MIFIFLLNRTQLRHLIHMQTTVLVKVQGMYHFLGQQILFLSITSKMHFCCAYANFSSRVNRWTFSPLSKESLVAVSPSIIVIWFLFRYFSLLFISLYLNKTTCLQTLRIAVGTYKEHKPSWEGLMKRGMERDSSWDKAATQYERVFDWAFIDLPYAGWI